MSDNKTKPKKSNIGDRMGMDSPNGTITMRYPKGTKKPAATKPAAKKNK